MEKAYAVKQIFILNIFISILYSHQWQIHYPYEPDTILTAWLIKKNVDKNAKFTGYDRNITLNSKYSINSKNSKFRRNGRFTAYEVAKRFYNISNSCSNKYVNIIKILELMPWKKEEFYNVVKFENGVKPLIPQGRGDLNLTKLFLFIDKYCKELK